MKYAVFLFGLMMTLVFGAQAQAQEKIWLQIEAQPTLAEAQERARAYTGVFPNVAGFQLGSGWYAIALGPYSRDGGAEKLLELKRERLIPGDSLIADGRAFKQQFWPVGAATAPDVTGVTVAPVEETALPDAPALPDATTSPEIVAEPAAPEPVILDETPAEARRAEAALARTDRQALQTALQWFGFYTSAIDGAFGPGTRKSMAAWQTANALEPTGILTTLQRDTLLAAYGQAQAELGLQTVTEAQAGIEITLPLALLAFDHYEPPFVHYAQKANSGARVVLISQPGDQSTLYGLYDILQTLEAVPLTGERNRDERSFTINARDGKIASYTYAELSKGLVKGYMLVWNPADDERMTRVLAAMQSSFKPLGDLALDPGLVPMPEDARKGLLSGLEVRRPAFSRTGFYVDARGTVLTTIDATAGCDRITLDRETEADISLSDPALGIALLTPRSALSPRAIAELQTAPSRLGGEIAVSGYSYEDTLPAPTLTFGTYEDAKGLDGEADLARLSLETLPGDSGGPVFDAAGGVLGMLLPRRTDAARKLPPEVQYALSATTLATKLAEAGLIPAASTRQGALAPEDLSTLANGMTVLVSCWK
ncbi:MAG: serine protease [Paracoccaceae bacterium]